VDVLVISDFFKRMKIMDRIGYLMQFKIGRIEALGYTYEELREMMEGVNPLALDALVEGIPLLESNRVRELRHEAKRKYIKAGRLWIAKE